MSLGFKRLKSSIPSFQRRARFEILHAFSTFSFPFVYNSVSIDLRVMPPISCECSEIRISLKVLNEGLPCFMRFFLWIWMEFDTGDVHKIRMSLSFVKVCAIKSLLSLEACMNFCPDSDLSHGPADACWGFLYVGHTIHEARRTYIYSKTCLKRNAIVPVFFFSVFTGFRFTKGCVLIKQSTKNMIA